MSRAARTTTLNNDNWVCLFSCNDAGRPADQDGDPARSFSIAHMSSSAADVRVRVISAHSRTDLAGTTLPQAADEGYVLTLGEAAHNWPGVLPGGVGSIRQVFVRRDSGAGNVVITHGVDW